MPPRKLLENPAPEPHDHLNIKHRLTYRAKRLSGHADSHYKDSPSGCQFYRSPLPESPKRGFLASLAHSFISIIPVNVCLLYDKSVFSHGEECIYIPKKVTITFFGNWPVLPGEMQNSATRKTLIVGLIALLPNMSLSQRERGALRAAYGVSLKKP